MLLFITAFGMGLAFCAPPGAVFSETLRRGADRGFYAALAVQIGSVFGDAVWAVLGSSGAGLLVQLPAVREIVAAMGGGLLAWLGIRTLYRIGPATIPAPASHLRSGDLMAGAALSLANPQSVAYWMALGSGLEAILAHVPTQRDYTVFFAGFMLACLAYCCLAAGLVVGIRRALTDRWYRAVNAVCGLALLAFALMLAFGTLHTLLHE